MNEYQFPQEYTHFRNKISLPAPLTANFIPPEG